MSRSSVVTLTVGQKGCGKSFRRGPHFIINEFLPDRTGVLWTSIPVFPDLIYAEVAKQTGRDLQAMHGRIKLLPKAVLDTWIPKKIGGKWDTNTSGPWDFFRDIDINAAHIQIDEVHNYCGKGHSDRHVGKWGNWLGEIRHRGATVEFISQYAGKVARELKAEAAVKLYIENMEDVRKFGVRLGDWWELQAGFFGRKYIAWIREEEYREKRERFSLAGTKLCVRDPHYFQFYDSFEKPIQGGDSGTGEQHEFEKRGKLSLVLWFLSRNFLHLSIRGVFAALIIWAVFLGGINQTIGFVRNSVSNVVPGAKPAAANPPAAAAPIKPNKQTPFTRATNETPVDLLQRLADLEAINQQQADVVGDLKAKLGQLSGLVAMMPDSIVLETGSVFRVGDLIDFGEYQGRRITSIDFKARKAVLDDGKVLRMSSTALAPSVHSSTVPAPGRFVSDPLRGSKENARTDPTRIPPRKKADDERERDAARGVPPLAVE